MRSIKKKDYYEILELHPKASQSVVEKAYRVLSKRYHPDVHMDLKKKWAEEKFKELSEAYKVLSNPDLRKKYDLEMSLHLSSAKVGGSTNKLESEEEPYFNFRLGQEYLNKTSKKSFWSLISGKWEKNLEKSKENFLKVIDSYKESKFFEDSYYNYIVTLSKISNYSKEYQEEVEKEFRNFLDNLYNSQWIPDIQFYLAKFYLQKMFKFHMAEKMLKDFLEVYKEHELAPKAVIYLRYAEGESNKYCSECEAKLDKKTHECPNCHS